MRYRIIPDIRYVNTLLFLILLLSCKVPNTTAEPIQYQLNKDVSMTYKPADSSDTEPLPLAKDAFAVYSNEILPSNDDGSFKFKITTAENQTGFIQSEYLDIVGSEKLPESLTKRGWMLSYFLEYMKDPDMNNEYITEPFWNNEGLKNTNLRKDLFDGNISSINIENNFISFSRLKKVSETLEESTEFAIRNITNEGSTYSINVVGQRGNNNTGDYSFIFKEDGDFVSVYFENKSNLIAEFVAQGEYMTHLFSYSILSEREKAAITLPQRKGEERPQVSPLSDYKPLIVTDGGLRFREHPNTDCLTLETLKKGTILLDMEEVTVLENIGNDYAPWVKVALPDSPERTGWVFGAFVAPMLESSFPAENMVKSKFQNLQSINPETMSPIYINTDGYGMTCGIRIPEGDGPQMIFDSIYNALVVKNVPLHPSLMSIEIKAVDPMGREYRGTSDPEIYTYDDYNGVELEIPAFSLNFNPLDSFKPGLWEIEISQTVMSNDTNYTDPQNFSVVMDSNKITLASLERDPFDMSEQQPYQFGDKVFIFGQKLLRGKEYKLGIFHNNDSFNQQQGGFKALFPLAGALVTTDRSGRFTAELDLGNDIPPGYYTVSITCEEFDEPIQGSRFLFEHP